MFDVATAHVEAFVHLAEQLSLRRAARGGDSVRAAVVVDATSSDHGVDRVAVRQRIRQALEHHGDDRFSGRDSIGCLVESAALTSPGQHSGAPDSQIGVRRQNEIGGGRDRGLALAGSQALTGLVHGDQPRRAGGIERHRRPMKVEEIREPCGEHRVVVSCQGARLCGIRTAHLQVVALLHSHEHPHFLGPALQGAETRILQRVPRFLQQQSLPRIHLARL